MNFFNDPQANAHPKAKSLMTDEFFWSPVDDAGPFGNDAGADAAMGFEQWRAANPEESPIAYLQDLLTGWGMPLLDWNELDETRIREFGETGYDVSDMAAEIAKFRESVLNVQGGSMGQLNDELLRDIILQSASGMGYTYLLHMDQALVGTAFAQFVMEGKLDEGLQYLAITALKRELLPVLLNRYNKETQEMIRDTYGKMLNVLEKAND